MKKTGLSVKKADRKFTYFDLYQSSKVREYWIVDPGNRFVRIYSLQEDGSYDDGILYAEEGSVLTLDILNGLEISTREIFG